MCVERIAFMTESDNRSGRDIHEHKLNATTTYLDLSPSLPDIEGLLLKAPSKISTRLRLNHHEFNQLATTIVEPGAALKLQIADLQEILEFSNSVNERLGFPETSDLIIRSARAYSFRNGAYKPKFSEPAVLVRQVDKRPKFRLLNARGRITSLNDFIDMVEKPSYLMIHDDNYDLQNAALHGSLVESVSGCELVCATGVLHARGVAETTKVPVIKINADYFEDLFRLDPTSAISERQAFDRPKISYLNSQNGISFLPLVRKAAYYSSLLRSTYERVVEQFGPETVMEFRIYPTDEYGLGRNLHLLDVNKLF